MTLVRRVARPMLAAIFVVQGLEQLRHPAALKAEGRARSPSRSPPSGCPTTPSCWSAPTAPRWSAAARCSPPVACRAWRRSRWSASLVPTTYVGHRFWEETDPATRNAPSGIGFLKNLGLLGGLLLASRRHRGQAGLAYRAGLATDSASGPPSAPSARRSTPRPQAKSRRARGQARRVPRRTMPSPDPARPARSPQSSRADGTPVRRPARSTPTSPCPAASRSPTASWSSPPWPTARPCCAARCARATPCSWRRRCAQLGRRRRGRHHRTRATRARLGRHPGVAARRRRASTAASPAP